LIKSAGRLRKTQPVRASSSRDDGQSIDFGCSGRRKAAASRYPG
jgi:hypothetical protein